EERRGRQPHALGVLLGRVLRLGVGPVGGLLGRAELGHHVDLLFGAARGVLATRGRVPRDRLLRLGLLSAGILRRGGLLAAPGRRAPGRLLRLGRSIVRLRVVGGLLLVGRRATGGLLGRLRSLAGSLLRGGLVRGLLGDRGRLVSGLRLARRLR